MTQVADLQSSLLAWAAGQRPHLPWRGERDPYRIWVSEIMLQQTRTETVAPYYGRFLERFPTVDALAAASLDDVLKAWEGLGYYARARGLHATAGRVVATLGGRLPRTVEQLRSLPGIGEYTAGAIASLAFGVDVPAVDGNGRRVLCRLYAVAGDPATPVVQRQLWDLARVLVPPGRTGAFNQALMDLGAIVCTPRSPSCAACPWGSYCQARAQGLVQSLPARSPRRTVPHYDTVAGLIWREGRLLIARRPPRGLLGGLWALPGGRREGDDTLEEALRRGVRQGLGIEIAVNGPPFAVVRHAYTHFRITLHGFACRHLSGEPAPLAYAALGWVSPPDLAAYAFPVAEQKVIAAAELERAPGAGG